MCNYFYFEFSCVYPLVGLLNQMLNLSMFFSDWTIFHLCQQCTGAQVLHLWQHLLLKETNQEQSNEYRVVLTCSLGYTCMCVVCLPVPVGAYNLLMVCGGVAFLNCFHPICWNSLSLNPELICSARLSLSPSPKLRSSTCTTMFPRSMGSRDPHLVPHAFSASRRPPPCPSTSLRVAFTTVCCISP